MSASKAARRHLTLKDVADKLGVSERSVHKIIGQPWFPPPVMLYGGERGWRRWIEDEIDVALATRAPRAEAKATEPERLRRGRAERANARAA